MRRHKQGPKESRKDDSSKTQSSGTTVQCHGLLYFFFAPDSTVVSLCWLHALHAVNAGVCHFVLGAFVVCVYFLPRFLFFLSPFSAKKAFACERMATTSWRLRWRLRRCEELSLLPKFRWRLLLIPAVD